MAAIRIWPWVAHRPMKRPIEQFGLAHDESANQVAREIKRQASEAWRLIKTVYDNGSPSGEQAAPTARIPRQPFLGRC